MQHLKPFNFCRTRLFAAQCETAFTLVELMVVVAIIGIVAALTVPQMMRSRKISQGERILNDARQMTAAADQWAVDNNKRDGDAINTTQAATYLRSKWPKQDILGNAYTIGKVGPTPVTIANKTKKALSGVGIDWGPY